MLSVGDVVAATSVRVGGDRMDQAIQDHLRRHHNLRIGLATAEQLRIDIGRPPPCPTNCRPTCAASTSRPVCRAGRCSPVRTCAALAGPLDEIVDAIRATLDGCSPDLAADLVDHGLILTGGAALLRQFDVLLAERTGLSVRIMPEPTTTVISGMLNLLEHLSQWQRMLESSDDDV